MNTAASGIDPLLALPGLWRGGSLARMALPGISSGIPELDAELPGGGWPPGALTEILPAHEGIGEVRLFGPALATLTGRGERLAWIAPPHLPYAPALAAAGIELSHLLMVRTHSDRETLWAAEEALGSNACGAVLVWLPGTRHSTRYAELRRLQLAAERGRSLALLFRPPEAQGESSPAALRIALGTADGGLELRILKRRGQPCRQALKLPSHPLRGLKRHAVARPSLALSASRGAASRLPLA